MKRSIYYLTLVWAFIFVSCKTQNDTYDISETEAREIAKEAYIFSYPFLMGYQAIYYYSHPQSPVFRAPLNQMVHDTQPADHTRKDVVTMNGDTPYSSFSLDLRAEPLVLSVPEITDRYYVFQCVDLFTHNFAYIGTRATGTKAGDYLFVGPSYQGDIPEERFSAVFVSETEIITLIGRTQLKGMDDLPKVLEVQKQYNLQPLSTFLGEQVKPSKEIDWVPLNPKEYGDARFIKYVNFYLSLTKPVHPEDEAELKRFEKIGIKPREAFDSANYSPEVLKAIGEGVDDAIKSIQEKAENIATKVNGWNMMEAFGPREFYQGDRLLRSAAVMVGIYANDKIEAFYPIAYVDADNETLDGSKHKYKITFTKENIPPAKYFWSVTMYNKQADGVAGYMVENPINRYLINSTTEGLVKDKDGGFSIFIQNEAPKESAEMANWLPAPEEPFYLVLRIYGPEEEAMNGIWEPPVVNKVE